MTNWVLKSLGELCGLRRDYVEPTTSNIDHYVALEHVDSGRTTLARWGANNDLRSLKARFSAGEILYGKLRPYLDKAVLASCEGICSTELLVLQPHPKEVDRQFLAYLLHSRPFVEHAIATTTGVNHPRTSWSGISSFRTLVPPLAEQAKIGRLLALVEKAISLEELSLRKFVELKEAIMAKIFREGLRGELSRETEVGPIPETWRIVECDSICDPITVGIVVTPAKYYVPTGVPCFRSFNVKPGRLVGDDLVFISESANELHAKSRIHCGDVLVVRTGYPGTACVVPEKFDGANCIDLLIARPRHDFVISEYLAGYLNSPEGKMQVSLQQGGLAQQHYNVGALRRLRVPLPSLAEQGEIAAVIQMIEAKHLATERTLTALNSVFHAILHQLMNGVIQLDVEIGELEYA
jgi:type I restriction enzyme, S subunit